MIGKGMGRARTLTALLFIELGCGQADRTAVSRGTGGEVSSPTDSLSGGSWSGGSSGGAGTPVAGSAGESDEHTGGSGGGQPETGGSVGASGSDGGSVGNDPDATNACRAYCAGYATTCPAAGLGPVDVCTEQCVLGISGAQSDCREGKLTAYRCISDAFAQAAGSCAAALSLATSECGGASAEVDACHEAPCREEFSGDGLGNVTELAICDNGTAELYCSPTRTGNATCKCTVNGVLVFETTTGFVSAKSAALDSMLFDLCKSSLP